MSVAARRNCEPKLRLRLLCLQHQRQTGRTRQVVGNPKDRRDDIDLLKASSSVAGRAESWRAVAGIKSVYNHVVT
jgi:hypothetical protein